MTGNRANVIVLTVDALRPDYLDRDLCPTMMELVDDGVYFDRAFSTINTTEPSLTSFYTGNYPRTTGLVRHGGSVTEADFRALRDATFVQERLRDRGYTTTAVDWIGDWHERGYDNYSGELVDSTPSAQTIDSAGIDLPSRLFGTLRSSLPPTVFEWLRRAKHASIGPSLPSGGWLPDQASEVVDYAVDRIARSDEPFYLFCHFWDTHAPYEVPDAYLDGVDASDPEARYRAAISFVDDQIERLLTALDETGVGDDTLLIVMGDHGECFGEHGIYFDHHGLYDPSIHVPLVLHHPDLPSGRRVDEFVQHVDLCPTILDFVDDSPPQGFDGESLLPLVRGAVDTIREHVVAEEAHTQRRICLRTDQYKYIELLSGSTVCCGCGIVHGGECELYNLEVDPAESNDLSDVRPDLVDSLRTQLYEWIRAHGNERRTIDRIVATLDDRGAYDGL